MLCLPEGEDFSSLNDYRLDLLVPGEIEDFSKFHTELGAVLEVLKVMEDREAMAELMRKKSNVYERLPRDAAELLRIFAKIDMEIEEDEEEINMCRAIDEMMAEAREEGVRAGEEMGRESLITNMMRNLIDIRIESAVLSRRRISPGINCAGSGRKPAGIRQVLCNHKLTSSPKQLIMKYVRRTTHRVVIRS